MNITVINQHFVKKEILSHGLNLKTAISETARAVGLTEPEIERAVLINTGFDSIKDLEEIHSGRLLSGDFVLNSNPQTGAFNVVLVVDGEVFAEQCYLVLRCKSEL
jgi:hypothetical protein